MPKDEYQLSTARLETVKEFIHAYKNKNDPTYIVDILLLIDNLIVSMCIRVRRTYKYLRNVPMQEMYQTAIIGLYEAIDKIHEGNEPAKIIPARINSYIISNIRKQYEYLEKHSEAIKTADGQETTPEWDTPKMCKPYADQMMVILDLDNLANSRIITHYEKKMLIDRYYMEVPNRIMAQKRHISPYSMTRRIQVVLKKVAVYFK